MDLILTFLGVAAYGVVVFTSFVVWRRGDSVSMSYKIISGWLLAFALLLCGVALLMVEAAR